MEQKLLVGYARVDITPEQYTNLGGNGLDAKRMCEKVLDRIYGTCIAITDGAAKMFANTIKTKSCNRKINIHPCRQYTRSSASPQTRATTAEPRRNYPPPHDFCHPR